MDQSTGRITAAGRLRPVVTAAAVLVLSGCFGGPDATRSAGSPADPAVAAPELNGKGEVRSTLIAELAARRTVLPPGSSYATVADAVMKAGAASTEAELRVKRLTAKARSKNWLPSLGPDVSLTSLSSIAASLLLDQALFDNGRRKAERDYAAADVEVAAVTLVTDLNQRVYDGLKLHVEVQRARDLAAITAKALTRMADFERIVRIRTEGGLSDQSEYSVIRQKKAEMEAELSSERQGAAAALAELEAMTGTSMGSLSGLTALPADSAGTEPLSVLLARAEAARTGAEVKVTRAGLMPGLGASAELDKSGSLGAGLALDGDVLGFGRKDKLAALDEAEEVSRRKVDEARREAERKIVALDREIVSLTAEQADDGRVLAEMEANLKLFTEQYEAGRRTLLELVTQFENVVAMRRSHASVKYQIAVARLEIALLRGVLVDGGQM